MMDKSIRRAYDAQRDFGNKAFKSGCYAPFVSLYFNPLGEVVACCRSQAVVLGHVSRDRLCDIWNGSKVTQMREALVEYRFENGCEFCEWMLNANDAKGALTHQFEDFAVSSLAPGYPKMLEFALSNTCNFACVQCCGTWSSTIRAHREMLPPLERPYDDQFFTDLRPFLPHLEEAKFYGGEPFLAAENFRVWDMMIEDDLSPQCHVLTNGSQWNAKVERVLSNLDVSIGVSIDAITSKAAFEKIRVRGVYEDVLANIERFRHYSQERGRKMQLSFSWMRNNWDELGPMLVFAEENGHRVNVIRVVDPSQFSLFSLSSEESLRIAERLELQGKEIAPQLDRQLNTWKESIQALRDNAGERQSEGYSKIQSADQRLRRSCLDTARDHLAAERWQAAVDAALKLAPSHKEYLWALLLAAHGRRRLGLFDAAEALLDQAQQLAQRHPAVPVARAWLRYDQQCYGEGLREAERALTLSDQALSGSLDDGFRVLALLHAELGHVEETQSAVDKWSVVTTDELRMIFDAATYLAKAGSVRGAVRQLDRVPAIVDPDQDDLLVRAVVRASELLRQDGDLDAAEHRVGNLLKCKPSCAELLLEGAWIEMAHDLPIPALEYLSRARAQSARDDKGLQYWIARAHAAVYSAMARNQDALAELMRCRALRPEDRDCRVLLAELERRTAKASGVQEL